MRDVDHYPLENNNIIAKKRKTKLNNIYYSPSLTNFPTEHPVARRYISIEFVIEIS